MSFDALTLSAVRDELEPLLAGSRIQRLVFEDEFSLALECFRPGSGRTNVLLSADPEHSRVQRLAELPTRGLERDTPFSLVARKHLRNAHIAAPRQPRLERVLELDCEQHDASGQRSRVLLIVEAMGRRGNLVLVDADGSILDAARRSPPSRNPRRPVLPHLRYDPPPPQDRLLPEQLAPDRLAERAQARAGSLAAFLAETLAGLSPLAGRELAFRATGSTDTLVQQVDWPRVVAAARAFLAPVDTHAWEPTLAMRDGSPAAFAAYRLSHLAAQGATLVTCSSVSDALEAYYAAEAVRAASTASGHPAMAAAARGDPLLAERRALLPPLERAAEAARRRIWALEQQLAGGQAQQEPQRRAGELLLAYQTEVLPEASEVELEGERIELDPHLSAVDNAQAYFARYRRARETAERVPVLLEDARQQAAYLDELHALVGLAEQMDAIRALRREVAAATAGGSGAARGGGPPTWPGGPGSASGSRRGGRQGQTSGARGQVGGPGRGGQARGAGGGSVPHRRVPLGGGWEALVGTSAVGNAGVTFDLAQPDDLWLHARGVPGAHVILRRPGASQPPPADVVEQAARLAAWHSAARASGRVEVDVAPRRHVRKVPNAPPGLVRYTHERTLRVEPAPA